MDKCAGSMQGSLSSSYSQSGYFMIDQRTAEGAKGLQRGQRCRLLAGITPFPEDFRSEAAGSASVEVRLIKTWSSQPEVWGLLASDHMTSPPLLSPPFSSGL